MCNTNHQILFYIHNIVGMTGVHPQPAMTVTQQEEGAQVLVRQICIPLVPSLVGGQQDG